MWPNNENTVVKMTGNGFQDDPVLVTSSQCVISRPQISHTVGSYVFAAMPRVAKINETAARAMLAARSQRTPNRGAPTGLT